MSVSHKSRGKKSGRSAADSSVFKRVLFGAAAGIFLFFALTALAAVFALRQDTDPAGYPVMMLAICALSAFCGGFIAVRPVRRHGLLLGMSAALPLYFAAAAAAIGVSRSAPNGTGWVALGVMLLSGGIAGILAANRTRKKKY